MAKFKQNNVELRDNQKVIFDSAKNKYMSYDGAEVYINTTISGVDPTSDYHLTTKFYVDDALTNVSGASAHGELTGLDADDHTQYHNDARGDARYYTQSQVDSDIATTSGTLQTQITSNASDIADNTTLIGTTSGTLQSQITTNAGDISTNTGDISDNTALIGTTSGTLQTQIDAKPDTFLELEDTPSSYVDERYVVSTSSGIEYLVPPVFGTEHGYASSDGESSTNSDTPQEKVTLSKTGLPSGTYHIQWGYEFNIDDNKDSDFNARVQIDDTTDIAEQGNNKAWKLDTVWVAQSGFYEGTLSGDIDIDIDYWDSAAAGVSIRRARLSIWRSS